MGREGQGEYGALGFFCCPRPHNSAVITTVLHASAPLKFLVEWQPVYNSFFS